MIACTYISHITWHGLLNAVAPTVMSAPPPQNPQYNNQEPPVFVSVGTDHFDTIIDALNDPLANTLRTQLHQLLHLRGDHTRHSHITRLVGRLQHIIHHHPNTSDFNLQLLYPIPRFDYTITTQGPGYATGKKYSIQSPLMIYSMFITIRWIWASKRLMMTLITIIIHQAHILLQHLCHLKIFNLCYLLHHETSKKIKATDGLKGL